MKKALSLLLALLLLMSLFAGCAKEKAKPSDEGAEEGSPLLKGRAWTDCVIVVDGVLYESFNDPYSKLKDNGWTPTGILNTTLDAKRAAVSGLEHINSKFDGRNGPRISVDFFNPYDTLKIIQDCNILNVEVDAMVGDVPYRAGDSGADFDFELPGGVKRGATIDQIKAAYGDPAEEEDYGDYTLYTYKSDDNVFAVYLRVYPEYGLQRVKFSDRRWRNPG